MKMAYLNYDEQYLNEIKNLKQQKKNPKTCRRLACILDYVYGTELLEKYWY
jgi:hypothetical protein